MAPPRIAQITLNATDALALARWWADRLGGRVTEENDGWFVVVALDGAPAFAVQKVDSPTPGPNRMHLDFLVDDIPTAVEEFLAAGASKLDEHAMGDFSWSVLADPEGNEFCLAAGH